MTWGWGGEVDGLLTVVIDLVVLGVKTKGRERRTCGYPLCVVALVK